MSPAELVKRRGSELVRDVGTVWCVIEEKLCDGEKVLVCCDGLPVVNVCLCEGEREDVQTGLAVGAVDGCEVNPVLEKEPKDRLDASFITPLHFLCEDKV